MGNVANVKRFVMMVAVEGSDCLALLSAASTSCSVRYISTFQSKKRLTSAEPRLVVDRTVSRPGTEFTASSIGFVMVTCICSTGITPLSTPMTTRGKFVSGNTEIGTRVAAHAPAIVSAAVKKKMICVDRASQKGRAFGPSVAAINLCPRQQRQQRRS